MKLSGSFEQTLHNLGIEKKHHMLIAVSGGIDSMVLTQLTHAAGFFISVAHVNFHLRGADSDADKTLVSDFCRGRNIPFFSKSLPIDKTTAKDGVQAEARRLRYAWFDELKKQINFDYLFTAHHQNDQIETLFINLLRGAGLKGLKSIPARNGYIIRPLLQFSKEQILAFAKKENIPWRADLSNDSDDYLRNRIRHGLAEEFGKLAPHANENASKSMQYLAEADAWLKESAREFISLNTDPLENANFRISIATTRKLWEFPALGKYVLDAWELEADQLEALRQLAESQTGKMIVGKSNRIFRDRDFFVFSAHRQEKSPSLEINTVSGAISDPIKLTWEIHDVLGNPDKSDPNKAALDRATLQFPLTLRHWLPGDRFVPYGMVGSKKVSDFLTDLKLAIPEKENVFVLLSGTEICWVVGLRIDDRFKLVENTKEEVRFHLSK